MGKILKENSTTVNFIFIEPFLKKQKIYFTGAGQFTTTGFHCVNIKNHIRPYSERKGLY